ncbi:N-acetylmuramoyl-L-alanine amidase [Phormidesmis priestleyi ULC007]|uniref:N-acetylmuramoyl-L-alanine amidase n=1 Tax=Phormidesmis priestleyi ULC007 TaxID=1920490 RepID=A0A2T1D614_9CYAN|nr:N-acetylmuramoyl-L-alanine amidase [Phormidesmis priestleyi ULC007]PZO49851.1 MAG: N-acetylmuramoyl-L-alanine amidase [Phormidesmis priestleyi]
MIFDSSNPSELRGIQGEIALKRNGLLSQLVEKKQAKANRNVAKGAANFFFFLLPFAIFLVTLPAQAAKLQFWRFDASQNRLEFTTDEGVQPKAQLIANPTRLVIDLPGVRLGRPAVTQPGNGRSIQSLRVGQFDKDTTRIVVELAPGYTIDPNQVRFRGASPQNWTVQLPTPQLTSTPTSGNPSSLPPIGSTNPGTAIGATQVQSIQPTPDGFFIRTSGGQPQIRVQRTGDRRQTLVDLYGASISPSLSSRDFLVNRNGVSRVQVTQLQSSPSVVRLTLLMSSPSSGDWQASASGSNGIVLLPQSGTATNPGTSQPLPSTALATVRSVELDEGSRQLLIRSDRPIRYTSGWDRASGAYRITIPSAQLARSVQGPRLTASSPLLQVRLRQETPNTVAILVLPAAGTQIGDINQPSQQLLALQLQRSSLFPVPPSSGSVPGSSIPVPPATNVPPISLPRVPNGKVVVVIDPGHGGPDPGAVGVGGLQEKEIVMDIGRQVAAALEQQGVQAVLTRTTNNVDVDLEPRVSLAERINATLFVSIHANSISLSRPDINGLETYYYQSGAGLAKSIHNSVLQGTGIQDRGVRTARFYVLRKTSMPSVLVEVGFVTGRDDASKLSTSAYRKQMADSIARGILQYIR